MARHRREPDSRPEWRTPDGLPRPVEPRHGRVGAALRRVIVTPTFAAGLGVVIAAVLAYPMSRTVFRYIAPNTHAQSCAAYGCGGSSGGGQPTLAAPRRATTAGGTPTSNRQARSIATPARPGASRPARHPGPAPARAHGYPLMIYRTIRQDRQG